MRDFIVESTTQEANCELIVHHQDNNCQLTSDLQKRRYIYIYISTPSNYRLVSYTSICCKVLEHILHSNIMQHIDHYNILTDNLHGFRKHHSCETQFIQTIHDLAQSLDNRTQIDMVIMNFSKAFDTLPHRGLLHKINK